ncbi:MAG: 16S rRNA (guanine(527)-N(7))-methyltransferase RsmG [Eubacteriales bacterium]|nr:16S rRNA (guanine(527)-N(7))-methyltransferase RsmG [Eubacteriales bacterium]
MQKLAKVLADIGFLNQTDYMIKFQKYMELILEWNEKVNLTSITDKEEFEIKHFVDSIAICSLPQINKAKKIIDVGTGAGFPGIPLAILYPEKKFLLMDSLNKRLKIIDEISREIGLTNVTFYHARAEALAQKHEYREQFDLCVSRAVANLAVLSEYCLPFVKVDGWFAAYKSIVIEDELNTSQEAIKLLGGRLKGNHIINIEGYELNHQILLIKKINNTPSKYPRKAGTPAKEPLK